MILKNIYNAINIVNKITMLPIFLFMNIGVYNIGIYNIDPNYTSISTNRTRNEKGDKWYNYLKEQKIVKKVIVSEKEYNNIKNGNTNRYIFEEIVEKDHYIYFVKSEESEEGIYCYVKNVLLIENKEQVKRIMSSVKSILKRKKLMLSKQEINDKLSGYEHNKCCYVELGFDTYICVSYC